MGTKRMEELKLLAAWTNHIIDYAFPSDESTNMSFKVAIQETLNSQDLRGMRAVARDMNEWTKNLTDQQRDLLNEQLLTKFGKGLETSPHSKVQKILSSGIIKNEKEYKILLDYVEENYADESKAELIKSSNQLLAKFHPK